MEEKSIKLFAFSRSAQEGSLPLGIVKRWGGNTRGKEHKCLFLLSVIMHLCDIGAGWTFDLISMFFLVVESEWLHKGGVISA